MVDLPRGRDLGPILAMWLVSLGILVFQHDLGSSLLFFGLFLIMLYVATERPGWLVVGGGAVRRPAPTLAYLLHRPRAGALRLWWNVWAHYGDGTDDKGRQTVETHVRHGLGRPDRPRPRPGLARGGSPSPRATSSSASIGEELGLTGVDRGDPALRPDRRARPARGADLPRRLRQAARHRPRRRRSRSRCSWSSAASPA